jgi:hypothetical protein
MYKNPAIKTTQVLIMDNKFMYKNPAIKTTHGLIVDNKPTCSKFGIIIISFYHA